MIALVTSYSTVSFGVGVSLSTVVSAVPWPLIVVRLYSVVLAVVTLYIFILCSIGVIVLAVVSLGGIIVVFIIDSI